MPDFGWSATCIVEAITLANKARKALKEAGGAGSQYQNSTGFLESLESTLEHIKQYITENTGTPHVDSIQKQLTRINLPRAVLKQKLKKYEESLAADSSRTKWRTAPRKIQWALQDLDEAVRKLKEEVVQPFQVINCILSFTVINAITNQSDLPWTEKCKELVDAIHLARLPDALSKELSSLAKEHQKHHISNAEALDILRSHRETLERIEGLMTAAVSGHECRQNKDFQLVEVELRALSESLEGLEKKISDDDIKKLKQQDQQWEEMRVTHQTLNTQLSALRDQLESKSTIQPSVLYAMFFVCGALASMFITKASCRKEFSLSKPLRWYDPMIAQLPISKVEFDLARRLDPLATVSSGKTTTRQRDPPKDKLESLVKISARDTVEPGKVKKHFDAEEPSAIQSSAIQTAVNHRKYSCPYNESDVPPFDTLIALEEHVWKQHNSNRTARLCPIYKCNRNFCKTDNLTKHLRSDHRENIPDRKLGGRLTPDIGRIEQEALKTWHANRSTYRTYSSGASDGTRWIWYCCQCNSGILSYYMDLGCAYCNDHWRCRDCPVVPLKL